MSETTIQSELEEDEIEPLPLDDSSPVYQVLNSSVIILHILKFIPDSSFLLDLRLVNKGFSSAAAHEIIRRTTPVAPVPDDDREDDDDDDSSSAPGPRDLDLYSYSNPEVLTKISSLLSASEIPELLLSRKLILAPSTLAASKLLLSFPINSSSVVEIRESPVLLFLGSWGHHFSSLVLKRSYYVKCDDVDSLWANLKSLLSVCKNLENFEFLPYYGRWGGNELGPLNLSRDLGFEKIPNISSLITQIAHPPLMARLTRACFNLKSLWVLGSIRSNSDKDKEYDQFLSELESFSHTHEPQPLDQLEFLLLTDLRKVPNLRLSKLESLSIKLESGFGDEGLAQEISLHQVKSLNLGSTLSDNQDSEKLSQILGKMINIESLALALHPEETLDWTPLATSILSTALLRSPRLKHLSLSTLCPDDDDNLPPLPWEDAPFWRTLSTKLPFLSTLQIHEGLEVSDSDFRRGALNFKTIMTLVVNNFWGTLKTLIFSKLFVDPRELVEGLFIYRISPQQPKALKKLVIMQKFSPDQADELPNDYQFMGELVLEEFRASALSLWLSILALAKGIQTLQFGTNFKKYLAFSESHLKQLMERDKLENNVVFEDYDAAKIFRDGGLMGKSRGMD